MMLMLPTTLTTFLYTYFSFCLSCLFDEIKMNILTACNCNSPRIIRRISSALKCSLCLVLGLCVCCQNLTVHNFRNTLERVIIILVLVRKHKQEIEEFMTRTNEKIIHSPTVADERLDQFAVTPSWRVPDIRRSEHHHFRVRSLSAERCP